ncbi:MAG TPA: inositol monophosphatase family protein [Cellulomonas sp.]
MQDVDVAGLMAVAERVAREAGELVSGGRPDRVTVAATKSSPQDVVTAMDYASEELLRRRLAELRPDDGVLGEERGFTAGPSGVTWVVDPIDGTVNYLYGLPSYSVSVAAVTGPAGRSPDPRAWTVLASCVHAPSLGVTYTAALGLGAWRDGVRLTIGPGPDDLADCLVGTGFGYRAQRRAAQGRVVAALLPQVRDIRRIGSAAVDLCSVASGALDAHYERGLQPWDLAGASLVVTEAGGTVAGLRGQPATDEMAVAGPPAVVARLTTLLTRLGADSDD